ncbi:MAG: MBL fold metallo-hydrolase, partial [Halanaerobium sp.]
MSKELEVTILANNTVEKREVLAEHGLSFYFKYQGREYLFDTGQGEVLFSNAEKLGIDLKN